MLLGWSAMVIRASGLPIVGRVVVAVLASGLLLAATGFLAHRKMLWTDEILTVQIATQPTIADFFSELLTGAEASPPLGHLLTRASILGFGEGHVAYRLPAILAFWLSLCGIYAFVRRRASAAAAWSAALLPLATTASTYAYEARPYALLICFTAGALLSWQRIAEGSRRPLWCGLLALSLAGAISSHWFGSLVLLPLGAGELVRMLRTKRHGPPGRAPGCAARRGARSRPPAVCRARGELPRIDAAAVDRPSLPASRLRARARRRRTAAIRGAARGRRRSTRPGPCKRRRDSAPRGSRRGDGRTATGGRLLPRSDCRRPARRLGTSSTPLSVSPSCSGSASNG